MKKQMLIVVNADGTIIRRTSPDDPNGCDIYVSTSSAGGGLQMMVAGVVREMTAESAKRAALGAGAIVMDTLATNDKRRVFERIERIRNLRPDMILLSGGNQPGTDGMQVEADAMRSTTSIPFMSRTRASSSAASTATGVTRVLFRGIPSSACPALPGVRVPTTISSSLPYR